ncbi:MAG: acyl-CoA thioesterase [Burkholderiales bacterium]|nr:acyl-CoA thioesterase [Bacteroidia bacterium]
MNKIFEQPIIITQNDIDENGHVNNISYLKWVQDVAIAHWKSVSTDHMKAQLLWVVSRHEIDYLKSAYLESTLIARTWVVEPNGATSERYVNICDAKNDSVIAKIKTTWYLLDAISKKPKRIDPEITKVFL